MLLNRRGKCTMPGTSTPGPALTLAFWSFPPNDRRRWIIKQMFWWYRVRNLGPDRWNEIFTGLLRYGDWNSRRFVRQHDDGFIGDARNAGWDRRTWKWSWRPFDCCSDGGCHNCNSYCSGRYAIWSRDWTTYCWSHHWREFEIIRCHQNILPYIERYGLRPLRLTSSYQFL